MNKKLHILQDFLKRNKVEEIQSICDDLLAQEEDIDSAEDLTNLILQSLEYMREDGYLPENWEEIRETVKEWIHENFSKKSL